MAPSPLSGQPETEHPRPLSGLKDETPTPHNALFLRAFGSVENAASHLKATLPEEISRHLDWSSLQVRPGSYIDEQLRDLARDLLFEVRTKQGDRLQIYVLFEHQSTPDPLMPFRLLRYLVRIWTDWIKEQSSKDRKERQPVTRLPPILPVVLYHGEEGWTVAREFSESVVARPRHPLSPGAHRGGPCPPGVRPGSGDGGADPVGCGIAST